MGERIKISKDKLLKRYLRNAQLKAAKHVDALVEGTHPDSSVPWKEASTQTRAALILAQGTLAAERAKGPQAGEVQTLGVVFLPQRIENADEWNRKAKAIDVDVRPALPAEEPKK